MHTLCKEYFSGIHIVTSFRKLMHSISYLKNKVTYLKCANSYIFIDDLSVNKDNTSQITVKGYLKGKPLNFTRNDDDFYIPLIGKIKVDKIACLSDPTCIENEKILERKKVFFHSPMMNRKEEIIENEKKEQEKTKFLFIDGESIEYESSSDQDNNQFVDIANANDESKQESCHENELKDDNLDFNCLSFEDLKKRALEKLSHNHIVLANDTEDITSIQFEKQENNFIPGDYLKITFMKSENNTCNDFFFINKIYNDQRETIRCSSFNPDNYFHPNFIKSHDPIIISIGLYRIVGFPVFFRVLEDGRRLFQKNSRNNTNIKCCFYGYGGKYMPVVIIRQIKNEFIQKHLIENKLTEIHERENMKNMQVDKKNDGISEKINFIKMNARHIVENVNIRYNYRIVGSGLSQNEKIENYKTKNRSYSSENFIYKKLNLIGKVYQVNGSTSFVKGMFTSSLEANKFILSNIKTISGIRGVIKKNVNKIGNVRCTFEAPVLKNDAVFLSTFVKVCIQEHFYDNINNYHKRKKEILDDNNKIETKKESDEEIFENFIGNEIKIQKEIKKPTMHRLISKLPLHKRFERQTIENEEFSIKNNEKMKNFIKIRRKELNDHIQKEEREKMYESRNLEKEKNRIKKEGIYKRMKIRKKRIK